MEAYYAMQWPRENLFCTGYIHEVMNFRYNWHETEYELNILLQMCIRDRDRRAVLHRCIHFRQRLPPRRRPDTAPPGRVLPRRQSPVRRSSGPPAPVPTLSLIHISLSAVDFLRIAPDAAAVLQ